MRKAHFTNMNDAVAVMEKTGRTWNTVPAKGGFTVRFLSPTGWRALEEIDVYHILNNGMYRVAA